MEMLDNTKNKREELNTISTKIMDEGDVGQMGWWWFKSKIFKLHPKLPPPSIMIQWHHPTVCMNNSNASHLLGLLTSPSIQHHVIKLVQSVVLFAHHSHWM